VDTPEPVRLLIVDDSALMRKLLSDLLRSSPEIEVVGTARDGAEALELAARLHPDVVTLDVEMPGMSGLEVLPALLERHAVPVVMVSALTQEGAEVTLTALELGAVDFLPKPDRHQIAQLKGSRDLLVSKVLAAARSRVRPGRATPRAPARRAAAPTASAAPAPDAPGAPPVEAGPTSPCVLIGISTGGPQALGQVLPLLTPPLPPILIVQHMPANFTHLFAGRLDRQCAVPVKEAEDGDRVLPNRILIAPGGRHMTLAGTPHQPRATLSGGPLVSGHKPSVDMLFQSGARVYQSAAVGLIMTGMGRDGVEGCKKILDVGGRTFGQDEATSVVYGMNKVAFQEGAVQAQFPLDGLPALITRLTHDG
jgi:two-component system chemotaxis response regulator CheB